MSSVPTANSPYSAAASAAVNPDGHPRRWRIMHVINMGTFMTTLDVGIVHLALPQIAEQFHMPLSTVQWVVTAYLLTMVCLLPILGGLSDRLERRKVYSCGMFVFGFGSLLGAFSASLGFLIFARVMQGIGATMIMANSQAMVRAVFPDKERGKALGVNTVIMSVGTLSGPAIGGFLVELGGWPLLFSINVPFAIAATLLGLKLFPQTERSVRQLDVAGAILLALAASLLFTAAVFGQQDGFTAPIMLLGAAGLLFAILLWRVERKREHAIVDRLLFRNRPIGIGNLSNFLYYSAQTATQLPLSFYMQHGLGMSASSIGLALAVQPVFMGLTGPLSGWSRDRFGALGPTAAGAVCCTAAVLPVVIGGPPHLSDLLVFSALFGIGTGLYLAANNAEIMSAAPAAKASLVGSMLALVRYLGMVAGIALAVLFVGGLGTQTDPTAAGRMADMLRWLFAVGGLLGAALLVCGLLRRKPVAQTALDERE